MVFDVITLFPGMFFGPLQESILARARRSGRVAVRLHDLRRWGVGPHAQVDDTPYGGGGGMILKPEPLYEAVEWVRRRYPAERDRVVLLSPQGAKLGHGPAKRLAERERRSISAQVESLIEEERERKAIAHSERPDSRQVMGGSAPR